MAETTSETLADGAWDGQGIEISNKSEASMTVPIDPREAQALKLIAVAEWYGDCKTLTLEKLPVGLIAALHAGAAALRRQPDEDLRLIARLEGALLQAQGEAALARKEFAAHCVQCPQCHQTALETRVPQDDQCVSESMGARCELPAQHIGSHRGAGLLWYNAYAPDPVEPAVVPPEDDQARPPLFSYLEAGVRPPVPPSADPSPSLIEDAIGMVFADINAAQDRIEQLRADPPVVSLAPQVEEKKEDQSRYAQPQQGISAPVPRGEENA